MFKKRKKGVSVVIEYVLLISLLIVIAILVYFLLKSYVPRQGLDCPDEVSLLVTSSQCDSNQLILNFKNDGNFDIGGYYIHATTSPEQETATFDLSDKIVPSTSQISPRGVTFGESGKTENTLIPNGNDVNEFDLTEVGSIYSLEILPIRWQTKENKNFLVLCTNAISKTTLDCESSGCTDDCLPGRRECVGNAYRTCVNDYDLDSCYEWNLPTSCLPTETCSGGICIPQTGKIYYLATWGNDLTGDGSITNPWYNLSKAWTVIEAGDTVYMRGGTYYYDRQVLSYKSGSEGNLITISAYPGEIPVITKSPSYVSSTWPTALIFIRNSNFLYVKQLEITGFVPTDLDQWSGIYVYDSQNDIFEQLNIHDNGKGMTVHNVNQLNILNCDFHDIQNVYPGNSLVPEGLEFYSDSEDNPNSVNYVDGCRFWWNAGKGISSYSYKGKLIINNSWAFYNGYVPGTFDNSFKSSGMGFSLGGVNTNNPEIISRIVTNSLAFKNRGWGFSENGDTFNMQIYNNIAYNNGLVGGSGGGFDFNTAGVSYYISNNVAYDNPEIDYSLNILTNVNYNSWDSSPSVTVNDDDFVSLDYSQLFNPRKSDGSLPDITFLHLKSNSDLINIGKDVGLPYFGSAPDLGSFETNY